MKIKFALIPVIVIIIATSGACKKNPFAERVYSIKVQNNSPQLINFFDGRIYPDTSLPAEKPYYGACRPGNFAYIDSRIDWSEVFVRLPNDTLSIFIFDGATVNTYNWDIIRNQYKILRRYDLSLQDLKNSNFTIVYQ